MSASPAAERRQHQRHPLITSVLFYHGPSQREFPGRCVDISNGGLQMCVPAASPLQPGHPIRLTMGGVSRPEFAGLSEKAVNATVVRVERKTLLTDGHLAVGVRFEA